MMQIGLNTISGLLRNSVARRSLCSLSLSALPGAHQVCRFKVIDFTGALSSIADGK
jgi:hypothetical protein